jgi:4-oxalmesaconate hydratase
MEMLIKRVGPDNVLFGSEMLGAGKAVDPKTGKTFDHTAGFLKQIGWLSTEDKAKILEANARKLFSRVKWPETALSGDVLKKGQEHG